MKQNDGVWYAYDVVIEGASLVNSYRSSFAAIAKNEGMDGLINDISERVSRHRSARPKEGAAAPNPP